MQRLEFDENATIYICTVVALYSTGHWIGANFLLAFFVVMGFLIKR